MEAAVYERLALWMRYFFVLLALAFVVRAWVITVRDNRRARAVRAWLPETGTIGAVSYTHLDVYKRQGYTCTFWRTLLVLKCQFVRFFV